MWITQLFEDKTRLTEFQFIPSSVITSRVKHELSEPLENCLQMPHRCDTTVIGEARHCLQTDCTAPGLPHLNEMIEPQIRTVNLEPSVIHAPAVGPHIGANYRVLTSGHIAGQAEFLQLLKFKNCIDTVIRLFNQVL